MGHFNFLCFIGCPYEGTIKNVGKAYCQPVVIPSKTPEDQSISHGTFLSTRYVSVVGPDSASESNSLTERIMEELVIQHPDGSMEVWDVHHKKYRKFDRSAEIKINYIGDQIRIEVKDKSGNIYKHESHLELFLQDLNN